ncbi:unnamed protein product [Linum tenue]|uniref:Uncharacterized protein n=1 Tax=Linum tenue TaxID=586396 RepID=A0AAV0IEB0_9ROSI|nr:unnamed protein product [Linum tenue]
MLRNILCTVSSDKSSYSPVASSVAG